MGRFYPKLRPQVPAGLVSRFRPRVDDRNADDSKRGGVPRRYHEPLHCGDGCNLAVGDGNGVTSSPCAAD